MNFNQFKYFLVFVSLCLVSNYSNSADCLDFDYSGTDEKGNFQVYYDNSKTVDGCLSSVVLSSVEYAELNTKSQMLEGLNEINPTDIAEAFTWGFGTYVFFWFLGYCISMARLVIKRA